MVVYKSLVLVELALVRGRGVLGECALSLRDDVSSLHGESVILSVSGCDF